MIPRTYWQDQQQREIDFVIASGQNNCDAIECKWKAESFETRGLKAFRDNYPKGRNILVSPQASEPYERTFDGLKVTVASATHLRRLFA